MMEDGEFGSILNHDEQNAWNSFRLVVTNFLGNNKSPHYKEIIDEMLNNFHKIGRYIVSLLLFINT